MREPPDEQSPTASVAPPGECISNVPLEVKEALVRRHGGVEPDGEPVPDGEVLV